MAPVSNSATAIHSHSAGLWILFWIFTSLLIVLVVVPFNPHIVNTNELDYSWMLALHVAHASRSVWGKDILFTYGPLGFLVTPVYYPDTFNALIFCRLILVAALLLVISNIIRKSFRNVGSAALWSLGLALLLTTACCFNWSGDVLPAIFAAAALAMQFEFARPPIVPICLSVAILALLSLAKISYFPVAAIVGCAIALDLILARRFAYCATVLLCFILALLVGWTLLGHQRLNDVGNFVATTLDIIKGYPQAMVYGAAGLSHISERISYGIPKLAMTSIIAFFAISLTGIAAWNQVRRPVRGWIAVVAIAAILFVVFRATCIRLDHPHLVSGEGALLAFFLIYAAAAAWHVGTSRIAVRTLFLMMLLVFIFAVGNKNGQGIVSYPWLAAQQTFASARAAIDLTLHDSAQLRAAYDNQMSDIRASFPSVWQGGNVDVYPWDNALAIALSDRYHPRPTLQSYEANTPTLANINARHLYSTDAPDRVLFDIDPIDGRFPNLDDCLSWPVLLARYEPVGIAHNYAVLRPRASPLNNSLEFLSQQVVSMDQWISLPRIDALLWAEMNITTSTAGHIQAALVRPAALTLFVRETDGTQTAYHMTPMLAKAGFLLSPTISDTSAFISLAKSVPDGSVFGSIHPNIAIKLSPADNWGHLCFSKRWTLRLSALTFHARKRSPAKR